MSGAVVDCGFGSSVAVEPSIGAPFLGKNRKHRVQSGKPVRFPEERLCMDYGLVRQSVEARLCVSEGMIFKESRMREIRTLGSASGERKRNRGGD